MAEAHDDGAAPSKFSSPEAYTPKYLAERILTSKAALEGERKQVTVIFADLKGSMELLADRDPEDARALLDAVLTRMMEAVHRYEGTVSNLMGDGLMAIFGAPLALEDHALRACYAALAIQNAIKAYAEDVRREAGIEVHVRVGLNSGEVVVRTIGSDLKMDYSAIGQTTHLASRMEQMAASGTVRLTGSTLRLAEGFVQVEPLGPVPVKGMSTPVEVFELKGATSGRTRFQATAAGGLTRFVGRTSELENLQSALNKAEEGYGQVFATVAEAGVGKSRLYREFTRSHRAKNWMVIESGSVSYGKATAYRPVIDLLKDYFGVEDNDDHRRIREKVTGKVLTLDESLTSAIPPILSLLEVPNEDANWETLDPPQRRQRTLDGVKRLLLREAQVQPLIVVFEDLHCIDTETQALLDLLVEGLPGARMLLLVNYRPEYEHSWANKTYYTRLRLDPLSHEGAKELLRSILGDDKVLDPLKKLLIERTEGNPFFLEESVQTLIESGALAGGPGAYNLTEEISKIQVPSTVQAILAARMDRLPPEEKRLLQTASVIGTHVPYPLLAAIAGMSEEELNRGLMTLQASEFLYETNLFPEREFTFKHALTHEVTYGSLIQDSKRELHAAIARNIESLYEGRLEEHVERLAYHAIQGELWDRAQIFSMQAGTKSINRSAYRDAVRNLEFGLMALRNLPPSSGAAEKAFEIRMGLRTSLHALGELDRTIENLREAEVLAEDLGTPDRLVMVYGYMSNFYCRTGNPDLAIESGKRALSIAKRIGNETTEILPNYHLGNALLSKGQFRQATERYKKNIEFLQGEKTRMRFGHPGFPAVLSRAWLTVCHVELGEFSEGISCAKEGIRIAEEADEPFSIAASNYSLGFLCIRQGKTAEAVPTLERSYYVCQTGNFRIWMPWISSNLGLSYLFTDNSDHGYQLIQEAIELSSSIRLKSHYSLLIERLSWAEFLAGDTKNAIEHAQEALHLSLNHKERAHEAWALRLLGELYSHPDALDPEKAEDCYRKALALATELGMRPLIAHCRKGLGTLYARSGREDRGREEVTAAMDMYREMGMDFWFEKAEEALAEV